MNIKDNLGRAVDAVFFSLLVLRNQKRTRQAKRKWISVLSGGFYCLKTESVR